MATVELNEVQPDLHPFFELGVWSSCGTCFVCVKRLKLLNFWYKKRLDFVMICEKNGEGEFMGCCIYEQTVIAALKTKNKNKK